MNRSSLDLNLLQVFSAVYATRNVTRAARQLRISQPALSNALARLRRALDDPLFTPTSRGMQPTRRARQIAPGLEKALSGIFRTLTPGDFDPANEGHLFNLAANDYAEQLLLPRVLELFTRAGARVSLRVVPEDPSRYAAALEAGELDLVLDCKIRGSGRLRRQRLYDDSYACLVRQDHPLLAVGWSPDRYGAAEHVGLDLHRGMPTALERALKRSGIRRAIRLKTAHCAGIPAVVERTDLVATLPSRQVESAARAYAVKALPLPLPSPAFTIFQFWHESVESLPAHRWLRTQFATICAEMG